MNFSFSGSNNRPSTSRPSQRNPFSGFGMDDFRNFHFEEGTPRQSYRAHVKRKGETVEKPLLCLLSEIYKGHTKRLRVTRTIYDEYGGQRQESNIIEIKVEPGWRAGTRVTVLEAGDIYPGMTPGDLVFVLEEKPHEYYKRDGDNLIYTAKISLCQALTGVKINLPTLDGTFVDITIRDHVIEPGFVHKIPGRGMPIHKRPGEYGDLLIKFDVQFPKRIAESDKQAVKRVFANIH